MLLLLHHLPRIPKLVEHGFALLVGKQTRLDHENLRQVRGAHIMPDPQRFFEMPFSQIAVSEIPHGYEHDHDQSDVFHSGNVR